MEDYGPINKEVFPPSASSADAQQLCMSSTIPWPGHPKARNIKPATNPPKPGLIKHTSLLLETSKMF